VLAKRYRRSFDALQTSHPHGYPGYLDQRKYPQGSEYLVLRSLVYFEDAEDDPMPVMLKPLTWEVAKERIRHAVRAQALK
jgi:hypothetical protein